MATASEGEFFTQVGAVSIDAPRADRELRCDLAGVFAATDQLSAARRRRYRLDPGRVLKQLEDYGFRGALVLELSGKHGTDYEATLREAR